jgi:Aspartyl protease
MFRRKTFSQRGWHIECGTFIVRCRLFAIIILVAAFFQSQAAPVTVAEFPFQYREGLLWVEVTIPQSDKPLNFLLDTGAGVSAINLNTAKRIGLNLGQEVTVHGVETMLTGYWEQQMSAKVGDVQLPHKYLAVDLEKLSHSCECPNDGLIGMDFFRDHIVQIDFDAQKIRLLKSAKAEKADEVLPLEIRPCGMRVPVEVNDHVRQWVRLDTGCATALQWVTSEVRTEQCTHQMAIGLAEISIPQTTTTVGIGERQFKNVPTGLHETAIFPSEAGLLGNGLIARFSTVTIDAKAGRVILKESSAQ